MTKEQKAIYRKAYYAKNKERELEKAREWKRTHKKQHAKLNNADYHRRKDDILTKRKRRYVRDREKILGGLQISREKRREKHNAYQRGYQREHPEWTNEQGRKRRARIRRVQIEPITTKQIESLYASHPHCAYCPALLTKANRTLDHIKALARGGAHILSNLIPACKSCNSKKGSK